MTISRPPLVMLFSFFFFNDTATTEIYPLSLHDALPIYEPAGAGEPGVELMLVVGPHRLDGRRVLGVGGASAEHGLDRRRSEEHTSELQSQSNLVCRLLLEKKKNQEKKLATT